MVVSEKDNETGRLRVKRRWCVQDGGLCDFKDAVVGDGRFRRELVVGVSVLDGLEECVCHFDGCDFGCSC